MGRLSKFLLLVIAAILLAGCAAIGEYAKILQSQSLSLEYMRSLDKWTREKTAYSEFSTRAKMAATLKSREFVAAYLAEYERLYQVEKQEGEKAHPAMEALEDITEILLYVYVPDREAIDLAQSDSIWKTVLISAAGRRFEPLEIRELQDVSPMVREFYPYVNPAYGKVYLLKFDGAVSGTKGTELPIRLVVTGVIAQVELAW